MKDGNLSGWKVAAIPISFWVIIGSVIYFWNARHEKNVAEQIRNAKPVVVKNITRVLMHEPWSYTFLVRNQNNRIGQLLVRWSGSVEIFDDLPAGESVRVEIMCGGGRQANVLPAATTSFFRVENREAVKAGYSPSFR